MGQHTQPSVGIDLGTTFSVVAHLDRDGKPVTLTNDEGDLTTPSVVFFDKGGTVVGREAIKAAEFEPNRVARFASGEARRRAEEEARIRERHESFARMAREVESTLPDFEPNYDANREPQKRKNKE